MTFYVRFVLLALTNVALIISLVVLLVNSNIDLSRRLIDLNLEQPTDLRVFLYFIGATLIGFVLNFVLLSSRKTELTDEQIEHFRGVLSN